MALNFARRAIVFIRERVVAYVIVFSLLALAFGVHQHEVNRQLKQADYKACIRAHDLAQAANVRLARLHQEPLPLPHCEHLRD